MLRIFGDDVTGGRHEEASFFTVGSGSLFARGALKKLYRDDLSPDDAVRVCLQALYDAADDDSATGGPDPVRKLYPIVYRVDAEGTVRLTDAEVAAVADTIVNLLPSGLAYRLADATAPRVPMHLSKVGTLLQTFPLAPLGVTSPEIFLPDDLELDPRFQRVLELSNYAAIAESEALDRAFRELYDGLRGERREAVFQGR